MTCASLELVEAMRGVTPSFVNWASTPAVASELLRTGDASAACGEERARVVMAFLLAKGGYLGQDGVVDCPACLALMATARGPERTAELLVYADHLEGVVAARAQAIADAPRCRAPSARLSSSTNPECGGPLALSEYADWNHRAHSVDRLVCFACGIGTEGTDAEVAAVRLVFALEAPGEVAKSKLATIRAARLFVPGESAARRKTA